MTSERWRQIGELFKATDLIDPDGREAWLRAACGGDDELRAEVTRLLADDERADRVGFLTPPGPVVPAARLSSPKSGDAPADDTEGFTPR
jgi:hypothetical protein